MKAFFKRLINLFGSSYSLPAARKLLLRENFFEFSFKDKEPDKVFFDTIRDPVEYHYIAGIYNWDDGPEVLSWIVNSRICDKATAKMIFWRSQPSHYTRFLSEAEAEWDADIFTLNKTIIHNIQAGFYTNANIYYNPATDESAEEPDYISPKAKWVIPDFMMQVSLGKKINLGA